MLFPAFGRGGRAFQWWGGALWFQICTGRVLELNILDVVTIKYVLRGPPLAVGGIFHSERRGFGRCERRPFCFCSQKF